MENGVPMAFGLEFGTTGLYEQMLIVAKKGKIFGQNIYDVIREVTQVPMELLDRLNVDVIDVGRFFNKDDTYWQKLELIKGYLGLYPKWFNPEEQADGAWLAAGSSGEHIGKMLSGATFFDQLIYPYIDGYPDHFNQISTDMSRVIWGGFGFPPYHRMNEKDFCKNLRETVVS